VLQQCDGRVIQCSLGDQVAHVQHLPPADLGHLREQLLVCGNLQRTVAGDVAISEAQGRVPIQRQKPLGRDAALSRLRVAQESHEGGRGCVPPAGRERFQHGAVNPGQVGSQQQQAGCSERHSPASPARCPQPAAHFSSAQAAQHR